MKRSTFHPQNNGNKCHKPNVSQKSPLESSQLPQLDYDCDIEIKSLLEVVAAQAATIKRGDEALAWEQDANAKLQEDYDYLKRELDATNLALLEKTNIIRLQESVPKTIARGICDSAQDQIRCTNKLNFTHLHEYTHESFTNKTLSVIFIGRPSNSSSMSFVKNVRSMSIV